MWLEKATGKKMNHYFLWDDNKSRQQHLIHLTLSTDDAGSWKSHSSVCLNVTADQMKWSHRKDDVSDTCFVKYKADQWIKKKRVFNLVNISLAVIVPDASFNKWFVYEPFIKEEHLLCFLRIFAFLFWLIRGKKGQKNELKLLDSLSNHSLTNTGKHNVCLSHRGSLHKLKSWLCCSLTLWPLLVMLGLTLVWKLLIRSVYRQRNSIQFNVFVHFL